MYYFNEITREILQKRQRVTELGDAQSLLGQGDRYAKYLRVCERARIAKHAK